MTSAEALNAPTEQPLEVVDDDGVVTLTLNRPRAGNAITMQLAEQLREAAQHLRKRGTARVVVLAGRGRLFCAGGDVREMVDAADRTAFLQALADTMHDALSALHNLPVPIVAAVNGPAAGAGIGLILAADIAVASEAASFSCAYGKIGLSPDCGVSALLPGAVGTRRAALFTLTDATLSARDALDWGLVTQVCPGDRLVEEVHRLAGRLGSTSARAAGQTARLMRPSCRTLAAALNDEADTIAALAASPQARALTAAFVSTAPPVGQHGG